MANEFNIEEYIKDLTPEQQEKAKACKTKEELIQLAAEEDVEIPMEALKNVAGGGCGKLEFFCKDCGSTDIYLAEPDDSGYDYRQRCCHCNSDNIGRRVVKE